MSDMPSADLRPFPVDDAPRSMPDVTEIHYDVWTLRVTLDFDDMNGVVYVDFSAVSGFRVLDEGDLGEMLPAKDGWLYEVDDGGWLAQESVRDGFTADAAALTEYLVAGVNDCVSVLCEDEPSVTVIEFDD